MYATKVSIDKLEMNLIHVPNVIYSPIPVFFAVPAHFRSIEELLKVL